VCSKPFKLLTEIVIVSRSRVTARALYVARGDKRHFRLSLTPFRVLARSLSLSLSLSFALALALFFSPCLSLTFSVLLTMKLGELGQHGKSIITKRGVMTQMLKSRSLRAKLFSVSRVRCSHSILIFHPLSLFFHPFLCIACRHAHRLPSVRGIILHLQFPIRSSPLIGDEHGYSPSMRSI